MLAADADERGCSLGVKMILTRPDDMRFDSFRSPSIQTLRMAFDAGQKVAAMEHHASAGWPTQVMAPETDPKSCISFVMNFITRSHGAGTRRVRAVFSTTMHLQHDGCARRVAFLPKKIITLKSSHASLASMPHEVGALIDEAARATFS
jgi:hypothetical protein